MAIWNNRKNEYYISCVKRHANENEVFVARGKRVSPEGHLIELCKGFTFKTRAEAIQKCRDLVKTKLRKKRGNNIPLESLPKDVMNHLEIPPEMQLSPQEMIEMLANIKTEKYVTFQDLNGMEELFDIGVQYLGFDSDDNDFIKVFDKFGQLRSCLKSRIATSESTERAIEVLEKVGK